MWAGSAALPSESSCGCAAIEVRACCFFRTPFPGRRAFPCQHATLKVLHGTVRLAFPALPMRVRRRRCWRCSHGAARCTPFCPASPMSARTRSRCGARHGCAVHGGARPACACSHPLPRPQHGHAVLRRSAHGVATRAPATRRRSAGSRRFGRILCAHAFAQVPAPARRACMCVRAAARHGRHWRQGQAGGAAVQRQHAQEPGRAGGRLPGLHRHRAALQGARGGDMGPRSTLTQTLSMGHSQGGARRARWGQACSWARSKRGSVGRGKGALARFAQLWRMRAHRMQHECGRGVGTRPGSAHAPAGRWQSEARGPCGAKHGEARRAGSGSVPAFQRDRPPPPPLHASLRVARGAGPRGRAAHLPRCSRLCRVRRRVSLSPLPCCAQIHWRLCVGFSAANARARGLRVRCTRGVRVGFPSV